MELVYLSNKAEVKRAVDAAGGPTRAAHACRVSNSAIFQWLKQGYVPRASHAVLLSEVSGVPVRSLSGLPPARDEAAA